VRHVGNSFFDYVVQTFLSVTSPGRNEQAGMPVLLRLIGRIGQQRYIARAFNCLGKHALMNGAVSGNPPGQNFAAFRDKIPQEPDIFEIDDVYLLNTEAADSSPAKTAAPTAPGRRPASIKIVVPAAVVTPASVSVLIVC
jgi:hypothetical protein